ncbi:MAG TPA: hypothetical protein VF700_08875 [Segetibacter sp.]
MKHKNDLLVHNKLADLAAVDHTANESQVVGAMPLFVEDQQIQILPATPEKYLIWEESFSQEACIGLSRSNRLPITVELKQWDNTRLKNFRG